MNKVLLVLGASSDLGKAYINQYHNYYDKLVVHYHNENADLLNLQNKLGEKIIAFQGDFLLEESTKQFIIKLEELGLIPTHILHIPAAKVKATKFQKLKWEDFQNDINIQLKSIFYILQNLLPKMTKNGNGKIVFILSSYTINKPPKYFIEYTSIKYAMLGFMKSLAIEYANKNIHINAVSPSMIETKFLENIPQLAIQQNASISPNGRNATVNDVIPMIQFLLSNQSDYINGQNIVISLES